MFRYTEIDRATRIGSMFADAFLVVFSIYMTWGMFFSGR